MFQQLRFFLIILIVAISALAILFYLSFPDELDKRWESIKITDRNGVPLREILSDKDGRSSWKSLDEISPHMIDAIVIAEDRRFYRHFGIDSLAVLRAICTNIKNGRVVSGGSTITEQLVRLVRPEKRTIAAKIKEAALAVRVEFSLSKKEILEQYLNRAPFGNQLFGIEAAARAYFGKPASDLSVSESAYLAVLPRAPSAYNPYKSGVNITALYKDLLRRVFESGRINQEIHEIALKMPVNITPRFQPFKAPHFVEMLVIGSEVKGQWSMGVRHKAYGVGGCHCERQRSNPIVSSFIIKTSLDISLQESVEMIINTHLQSLEKYNVTNASAIVMDNKTGEILVLVGSRDYYDLAHGGQVNGATALRQPGSALKPFTYALALERGYTASTILPDVELSFATEDGSYIPKNYDEKFHGPVRLRSALANSLNVPAVYLTDKLGVSSLLTKLRLAGFDHLGKGSEFYGLGLTLGNGEVTLFELARAYATLARGGVPVHLSFTSAVPSSNLPLPLRERVGERGRTSVTDLPIFSKEASYIIADILSDDASRRMSFGEDSPLDLPFRVAAKTGTSKNFRDNWTAGFTPEFTVAVWVGNFDGSPMNGVSGITGAAPIFRDIFTVLSKYRDLTWFDVPKDIVHKEVCPLSGLPANKSCETTIDEIFIRGTEPMEECAFHVEREIDRRNGLLISASCDERWAKKDVFINLPQRYDSWARANGINTPPSRYSPLCRDMRLSKNAIPSHPSPSHPDGGIQITNPDDGDIYSVDPYIPERLQRLHLTAESEESDGGLVWYVDGEKATETDSPHIFVWPLKEGNHSFQITTRDQSQTDQITITVNKP